MESESLSKVAIVGAGRVGATIAYTCLLRGIGRHLVLHDVDKNKVEAATLDLNHGLQFAAPARIDGSDDMSVCANADVVVITAGARQKVGQTRGDLAESNLQVLRRLIPEILKVAPDATLLIAENPVDILTQIVLKISGLPRQRVLGSGTVLDSSRFRFLIAQRCKVSVQNVHAFIAGKQGDSEIPLWSTASIGNITLHNWAVQGHGKLTVRDRSEIFENVKSSAQQIIQASGASSYANGLAVATIIQAILTDENRVLPVSAMLSDYRGISDVCLSVPSIVNRAGVETALPIPMNQAEETALQNSAAAAVEALKALGL